MTEQAAPKTPGFFSLRTLVILVNGIMVLLGFNWILLLGTGNDLVMIGVKATSVQLAKTDLVWLDPQIKVSKRKFKKLYKEILPERLVADGQGTPLDQLYQDLLEQYDGELIDEEFVRQLLLDMKDEALVHDGHHYYRMDGGNGHQPSAPIDPTVLEKQTISVAFYLNNFAFYSKQIFQNLTKQSKVAFTRQVDDDGKYIFEALEDMTQAELYAIATNVQAPDPEALVEAGTHLNVPAHELRQISRIFKITRNFVDHLGTERQVTVYLDLKMVDQISSKIYSLPDGTILANENGLLSVQTDALFVRRVDGYSKGRGRTWSYYEDGDLVFKVVNGRCTFNAFGNTDIDFQAQVYKLHDTDQQVLEVRMEEGTISLREPSGRVWRTIDHDKVVDADDNLVNNPNDLGVHFQKQVLLGRQSFTEQIDLDRYVKSGPLMQKLVHDITSAYDSDDDRARALLAFVQSFEYEPGMILGQAKTPKDALISDEIDCKDASIFTVSLWEAAGFDAGFLYLRAKREGEDGHASPVIADSSCCSGDGHNHDGQLWLYGEATAAGWQIGQDAGFNANGLYLNFFQEHDYDPVTVSR